MDLLKVAEQAFAGEKKEFPAFKAGDQITVGYRIKEGNKERVQEVAVTRNASQFVR